MEKSPVRSDAYFPEWKPVFTVLGERSDDVIHIDHAYHFQRAVVRLPVSLSMG